MPFDTSGNYTRIHNWTADRNADIKIQATRVDEEHNDFAAAFNLVFFRNGLVPMTGPLDLGGNELQGLPDGTAASPAIVFEGDTDSGFYFDNGVAVSVNGAKKASFAPAGLTLNTPLVLTSTLHFASSLGVISSTLSADSAGKATYSHALNVVGALTRNGNKVYDQGNMTFGTANPTGGVDGDLYFQYAV